MSDANKLTYNQKIGQLIMPRIDFNVPQIIERAKILVQEYEVGGFIIFNGKRDIVSQTTHELQSLSTIPLLFGCDAERGLGQIVSDKTLYPFTMSMGAVNDEELVYRQASLIAEEMSYCGLNLIFAPVADVNSNPDNPIINIRSYGDNPERISRLCSAFIKGAQDKGVLACAKHFPGHGRTGVDSHIDLPVLNTSVESLGKLDLIPFQRAIEAGVATIMTAHIAFDQIGEGNAATVSKELISDVLRESLGFNGLVITDSLHMEGIIKLGDELYLSRKALMAGCDIILDPQDPVSLIENLTDSATDLDKLDAKVERVLSAKQSFLRKQLSVTSETIARSNTLKATIAKESVCLINGRPLKSKKASVITFDVTKSENLISEQFINCLEQSGIELTSKIANQHQIGELSIDGIPGDTAVICLTYTTIGAWKKQSVLPESFKKALLKIESLPNETVLVSFGSPYVIKDFDHFQTLICSFDLLDICQQAAADVLIGKVEAKGILPVSFE